MAKREKITLLLWLLLSIFVCFESWRLGLGSFSVPGPGFLTFGVAISIIIGVVLLFLKESTKIVRKPSPLFRGKKLKNIIYTLTILFAYPFFLDKIGFALCNLVFLGFSLRMIEPNRWRTVLVLSISVAAFSYFLFILWLEIPLPEGKWVNQLFSSGSILWKH